MPPPPIITAATSGDTKQIRKILEADATKIHAVGSNGNFPLHVCVQKETAANVSAIKILLEFGADPTAENDNGDTPLAIAQKNKFTKMLPMLEDGAAAAEERAAAERKARMEAKAAAAKKKAEEGGGDSSGGALKFRRVANVGWKPLKTDWEKLVKLRKPLTDDFKGRKISITFSNKTADAAFAKGLDAALREAEADSRLIQKWPVNGWVQGCVFAADEADFVIVLHSANYDEGHYCVAERYLVKESNVPHVVLEIDTPSSSEYAADPTAAMVLLKNTIALTQTERVNTNTMPCTWSLRTLSKEDQAAYSKITKVWTPKEASSAPIMIDLDKLAGEQLAAAKLSGYNT